MAPASLSKRENPSRPSSPFSRRHFRQRPPRKVVHACERGAEGVSVPPHGTSLGKHHSAVTGTQGNAVPARFSFPVTCHHRTPVANTSRVTIIPDQPSAFSASSRARLTSYPPQAAWRCEREVPLTFSDTGAPNYSRAPGRRPDKHKKVSLASRARPSRAEAAGTGGRTAIAHSISPCGVLL